MTTLTIVRGLPGSGKTTWASREPGVRVSRDDLRKAMFGTRDQSYYARTDLRQCEDQVTKVEYDTIKNLLKAGVNVIADATNLPVRRCRELMRLAEATGADVTEQVFNTDVETCVRRQVGRPTDEQVPEQVIRKMWERYVRGGIHPLPETSNLLQNETVFEPVVNNEKLSPIYLVDIDGTLAKMNGRGPHDYHRVLEDSLNPDVVATVKELYENGQRIILMSGRPNRCREDTERWLARYGIMYTDLFMRADGDGRNDAIVKYELFNEHIRGKYRVVAVFDDRDRVVRMWREIGLTVFQVDYGDF